MEYIVDILNEEEIKLACQIANNIEELGMFVERYNLMYVISEELEEQINADISKLTPEARSVARNILRKIQWEHHSEKVNEKVESSTDTFSHLPYTKDIEFQIKTKVGNIYTRIAEIDHGVREGLFKLITICASIDGDGDGMNHVFAEFENIMDDSEVFIIWFCPNMTYSIANN